MSDSDSGGRRDVSDSSSEGFAALDLVPEAVVVVDAAGRVLHCNDRAGPLLGLSEAATGRRLAEVLDLRDDAGRALGVDAWAQPQPVRGGSRGPVARLAERVVRVHLPAGRVRPVTVSGRYGVDGAAVLTFRHAGRRERVDIARSDLVATVSHEVRSPLTSVKGFTRTLLAKWDRFSDDQKRQMLATINADADRVTRLLTELLDVARIDVGRVQLHRVVTDVAPIIERVVEKVRHHDDGRDLLVELAPDLPRVPADPDKLEQVLTNLIENALRYAPGSDVRVSAARDGRELCITVADEGPGVPADQHRQIFAKFARGRGDRRAGTGLGLYITRGLVEAHGGRVWVESEPGHGARFHVALPLGGHASPP